MASFNQVTLLGNLTRDVEIRFTPKGTACGKFGLAVNRKWSSEGGEQKEEVTFVDVDVFGKQAETLAQYCKKGSPLFMQGRLRTDQWEDKQTGQKRSRLCVVLEVFQLLGSKSDRPAAPSLLPATRRATPAPAPEPEPTNDGDDTSVPF